MGGHEPSSKQAATIRRAFTAKCPNMKCNHLNQLCGDRPMECEKCQTTMVMPSAASSASSATTQAQSVFGAFLSTAAFSAKGAEGADRNASAMKSGFGIVAMCLAVLVGVLIGAALLRRA